ncbi:MAG TPA: ABC transporter ATP-binding protein, partial [Solirubrobacterales bacterium]
DLTYLYITHDLATAKFFCDRIAIMYLGRIVEIGPSEAIYEDPKHPYTQALLRAIPEPDPRRTIPRDLPRGEVPDASRPPLGCSFHPRCPKAFEVCGWEARDLKEMLERRWSGLSEEGFEAERAAAGPVEALDVPTTHLKWAARGGATGADLRGILDRSRAADPADPFWTGVSRIEQANGALEVDWFDPIEPRLLPSGSVNVECHLYDEESLAEAAKRRESGIPE